MSENGRQKKTFGHKMNSLASIDFNKPVPTKAALVLQQKNKLPEFQALVFEEPKPQPTHKKSKADSIDSNERRSKQLGREDPTAEPLEFDIKQARQEVLNFAIANQRLIKNKEKMEKFKLIKMGAKPTKKVYKNYKELLGERKRLKEIREERRKFHQLGKNQTGAAAVKCRINTKVEKRQKKRAPVTSINQHYGVAKPTLKRKQ